MRRNALWLLRPTLAGIRPHHVARFTRNGNLARMKRILVGARICL